MARRIDRVGWFGVPFCLLAIPSGDSGALAGAGHTAAVAPPPPGVAAFVRDQRLTRYAVALADLDGDGRPEALVYAMATAEGGGDADLCGSGGCDLDVLSLSATGYRLVTTVTLARPPIRILDARTLGWHDLGVLVAGGGIVPGYEARLHFGGAAYPTNPTVPPAEPSKGAAGRTVIAAVPPVPPAR